MHCIDFMIPTAMAFHSLSQLFFLLLLPPFVVSQTSNITLGSHLVAFKDSPSWKSPSGEFAFGFYQLQNQEQFLLAIWFDQIPDKTTIWYANGDNPAAEGSRVELTVGGKLQLTSPNGQILWKATFMDDGTAYPVDGAAYAAFLDTGNFVLVGKNLSYAWESFKNPADTLLPTQELPLGGMLSSRQTRSNYSRGRFQLRLLPDGNLVLNTISLPKANAYAAYYISGTFDEHNSANSGYRVVFNESGYIYIVRRNGQIFNLTTGEIVPLQDYYYRATLDFDGIFREYAYPKPKRTGIIDQSWAIVWNIPPDICNAVNGNPPTGDFNEGLGSCGFNSYCKIDSNARPSCECLPGFNFSDPNNKFNGCIQDRIQECNLGPSKVEDLYDMHELPNTFWPTSANFEWTPSNEDECRQSCLYDCQCVVAVLREGGCSKKKLPLTNGMVTNRFNGKAFVKVARSINASSFPRPEGPGPQKKDQSSVIRVGSFLLGGSAFINFLLITAGSILAIWSCNKKRKPDQISSTLESNPRPFTYQDLEEATDGFKEELGRGAFGVVYKGVLRYAHSTIIPIAVKKLDRLMQEGEKEFKAEVNAIAKTHHKNLVSLIGFCEEGLHRLLVYEFMSNGTLASLLYGDCRPEWKSRTKMAFEIARGLVYLHEECSRPIIHCDVARSNASNFLNPKGSRVLQLQKKDQSTPILVRSFLLGGSAFINFLLIIAISILAIWSCNKKQKPSQMSSLLESNLQSFTYQDLEEATDGFKEELGRGSFGIVYKGVLHPPHSTICIAVKKLDKITQEGEKEFKTEVNAIAKTLHKNLVRLIGFCEEGPHKLLSRTQMAFEIARGLVYLHEECSIPIIHCDIKPQNILLDDSFIPRISDFGLAKLLMSNQTRTTTAIRGTKGYVAAEWFRNMPITTKVDVYSYGVMLLEIICCRKNYEEERENEEEAILTDWVYDCYKERRLDKVVENDEEAINDMTKVERLVMVAIWCIQEDPSLRPSMRKVTHMLEGVVQVPMPPCPTPFTSLC
ncbi:hypothetical protein SLEP1_g2139 [Rubroshorea leprosula]|uniref:non-specific serine/threonine protein kinase n=1 Tax=Rubroshorea leprosula TaxID=152421 RepID=A0AAV5HPF8_9ROSI|nr:hypothetical protein SLEP1_g2139 [Rubroshorea leprosula]